MSHPDDEPMYAPRFRDLLTGKEATGFPMSLFWWADGNGSCDCNRLHVFERAYPEHELTPHEAECEQTSECRGCRRYVVVGLSQGAELQSALPVPPEVALPLMREMNDGYAAPWGCGWASGE